MIDYKKLKLEFDQLIEQVSKDEIDAWLKLNQEKDLIDGLTIEFESSSSEFVKIELDESNFSSMKVTTRFAVAA